VLTGQRGPIFLAPSFAIAGLIAFSHFRRIDPRAAA
jgi:hypothetical protein